MRGAKPGKWLCALILALAVGCISDTRADAGWLSSLLRERDVGGTAAGRAAETIELAPLKSAAAYLDNLEGAPQGALAAHATSEGHWRFVNRDGQTFTVGTPDEMQRVIPTLVSDAPATGKMKMTLYLSEDSVFANRSALDELPPNADLNVVANGVAYRIARSGKGSDLTLKAYLSPNLAMELRDQSAFEETAFLLARQLNKSNIRTIAFETGVGASPSSAPKIDPVSKVPLVDQLDPEKLASGLHAFRGQTALVTGRVEGGNLIVAPTSGGDIRLPMDRLAAAASNNDVNLVVLQSDSSRQAGGRNWLWQKIKIGGLDAATETSTFGDFLDALAARRGGFLLNADREETNGRVRISAVPDQTNAGLSSDTSNVVEELVSHVTGEVITNAVSIDARDRDSQTEHDIRIIPWLPASVQFPYFAGIVAGIAGLATTRKWWSAILRALGVSATAEKPRTLGRVVTALLFFLIFLPIAGFPAFAIQSLHQLLQIFLAPFRWIRRRSLIEHI